MEWDGTAYSSGTTVLHAPASVVSLMNLSQWFAALSILLVSPLSRDTFLRNRCAHQRDEVTTLSTWSAGTSPTHRPSMNCSWAAMAFCLLLNQLCCKPPRLKGSMYVQLRDDRG